MFKFGIKMISWIFARVFTQAQSRLHFFILSTLIFSLSACHHNGSAVYTVKAERISHVLSYKSTISPLQVFNVQTPADATIQTVNFQPGDLVQKNQLLLTLYSPKYIGEYQNAMLSYLKAKEDYTNAQNSFYGTEDLWKHGLVSRDEYSTQKTSLANSYAMLLQQQEAIQAFLPPGSQLDASLSLENKATLNKLFINATNVVNIFSPTTGIALAAVKSSNQSSSDSTSTLRLEPGMQVHQADSLLSVGDLTGFNLVTSVSEMDINKIQKNMTADVTSDAFPETLKGYVAEVGVQAKNNGSDVTLPEFPVRIVVPTVPTEDLKNIRIGMTAKVGIETGSTQQILIPLEAVGSQNGQDVVKKITGFHTSITVPVTTGDTTLNQVTILNGLKVGDRILVPYPS